VGLKPVLTGAGNRFGRPQRNDMATALIKGELSVSLFLLSKISVFVGLLLNIVDMERDA
jgi:hypothetical protein